MLGPMESKPEFAGIYEKLKRADENIVNLGIEINAFLKLSPDSRITNDKAKAAQEWAKFHVERTIPPRFGVLAGEIIYHLRSSLDHLAWILSSESYRENHGRLIGFPINTDPPRNNEARTIYNRQIAGITSTAAITLIGDLQPYKVAEPADEPLAVIQYLNNIDKHHNLVMVLPSFDIHIRIPAALFQTHVIDGLEKNEMPFIAEPANNAEIQFSRQISFAELGEGKNRAVIPALTELSNEIRDIVERFATL